MRLHKPTLILGYPYPQGKHIKWVSTSTSPFAQKPNTGQYLFVKINCYVLGTTTPFIQVYLSAVRHSQIITGRSLPSVTPRLSYVLKGIRRSSALTYTPRERLPITFPIMARLHAVLLKNTNNYRDVMIWAACCLAYFGLLRVSEFTTSSPNHFDPSKDLLLSDIALDNRESPSLIQITLKQSKGDQFRKGEKYTWEELLMRYVLYMLWCNTLPGGAALQDHFSHSQTVNG